jgi:predicted metal-dependent hydrolase
MQKLARIVPVEDLSVTWCNSNRSTTSVMEAISFVTPVVENFVIRTVSECIARQPNSPIDFRCRAFIREESYHSRAHRNFNASLLNYLGAHPPGLAFVQSLLDRARRHLSPARRLQIVAALEHLAAVFSREYLDQASEWSFGSAFARELFARHAREELAHRSVAFDLWSNNSTAGRFGRTLTMLAILLSGLAYATAAVPWIIYRKTGNKVGAAFLAVAGSALRACLNSESYSTLRELFSFAGTDFHPDKMAD